jgi:hypothetical protein
MRRSIERGRAPGGVSIASTIKVVSIEAWQRAVALLVLIVKDGRVGNTEAAALCVALLYLSTIEDV